MNHCLAALLKNNENKKLRSTISLLHILGKNKKIRRERKISNLSKLMIFASYQKWTEFHNVLDLNSYQ